MKKTIKSDVKWIDKTSDPLQDIQDFLKLIKNPYYQSYELAKNAISEIDFILFHIKFLNPFYNIDKLIKRRDRLKDKIKELECKLDEWQEVNK